jgi:hypothetical protein
MIGFFRVLELLADYTGCEYSSYYADVKSELYKLFDKYVNKFGAASSQRIAYAHTGKKKQAWGRIFGGPDGSRSGVVGPPPGSGTSSSSSSGVSELSGPPPGSGTSSSSSSGVSELSAYLDSGCVTSSGDDFDILLWWKDHKLTYPILCIMARNIMSVSVSTASSESCFSLSGRILEDRRRRLLPENVEMLTCIKVLISLILKLLLLASASL